MNPKTALDILTSESHSLIRMGIEKGEIKVKALLTVLLADTLDFFSIGKTMSASQVAQTINILIEDYSVYKIDYFILCFKRAKKGNYGITYDRIDGQVILEWLTKFDGEYTSEIENYRIKEKRLIERDTNPVDQKLIEALPPEERPVPMPDYVKEFIKNQNIKKIENLKKISERSAEQLKYDGFFKDFNKLLEDNHESGKRFVTIDEVNYDVQEYMIYRLDLEKKGIMHKKRINKLKRLAKRRA